MSPLKVPSPSVNPTKTSLMCNEQTQPLRPHKTDKQPKLNYFLPAAKPAGLCFANVIFLDIWLAVALAVVLALAVVFTIAVFV